MGTVIPGNRMRAWLGVALTALCWAVALAAASSAPGAGWIAPVDLSAPGRDANGPQVGMAADSETVAIWDRKVGSIANGIQATTRGPGAPFAAASDLGPGHGPEGLAIAAGGQALAVWAHFTNPPGSYSLEASARPKGGAFGPPSPIASFAAGVIPGSVELAMNASGEAVLAWTNRDPSSAEDDNATFVEAAIRSAGGGFSTPVVVSPQPIEAGKSAGDPAVAISPAGDATVAWRYGNLDDGAVQASFRPAASSFGAPEPVSEAGAVASSPSVAIDPGGTATAAWVVAEGEDLIAKAASRPSSGGFPASGEPLSETGGDAFQPMVAEADSGSATVVWSFVAGERTIQAASRAAGGEFGPALDLSAAGEAPLFPDLAANPNGDAVIAWSGSAGSGQVVRAVVRDGDGPFSAPTAISATAPDFFHPDSAVGGTGDATVVWVRSDGANEIVQAAGYDAAPPSLRSASIPSTGVVGVPLSFSVDPFDVWSLPETAFDFGDGTSAPGSSVTHVYSAPGRYRVVARATDAVGATAETSGEISILASNDFRLGKLKRNKRRGTATLTAVVPGPGTLTLTGKGVRRARKRAARAGKVKLPVKTVGKAARRLNGTGKTKLRLKVVFAPDGGPPATKRRPAVLKKSLGR